jgi:type I restriction enzyme S subunit
MTPAKESVAVEPDRSYPNVGIYSFGRGLFRKLDIDGGTTSATALYRIHAGQFIYSRLFAFEGAYGYITPQFDSHYVSNEFPTFDPDPTLLDARWLACYLRSPERWAELGGSSKGMGVRRQRVPIEAVMAYIVWLPPIHYQQTVVASIDQVDTIRKGRLDSTRRIESLVPAMLTEAFAGFS